MAPPILLLTSILIFSLLSTPSSSSSSSFSPTVCYFLNCGSSITTSTPSDSPNRFFVADSSFLSSTSSTTPLSNPSSASSSLYSTARLFKSSASYKFTTKSQGTYMVRLHFFPFASQTYNLSEAKFTVSVLDRFALLTDFSVPPGPAPVVKEFLVLVDVDEVVLAFTGNPIAFVNAVEVFSAPQNLVDGVIMNPTSVGTARSGNPVGPLPSQGLETIYRVNVGGALVTPANDTLWRTWVPDDPYVFDSSLSFTNSTSATIRYGSADPRRTPEIAPPSIYNTARTMAVTPLIVASNPNFNFNVTWSFQVSPSKTYFIRMHFCDFLFNPVTELFFDVYIGQLLAYADLQPSAFTDQTPAAPFYMDFTADSDSSGIMNVSVGRSNRSTATTANALLNGLEIMKIGLDPATTNRDKSGVSAKILISSVVGGVVFVLILTLAAVLLCKRRKSKTATEPNASPATVWSPFRPDADTSGFSSKTKSNLSTSYQGANHNLQIPFDEIKLVTNNFDEKLLIGSGGFGKVYKGMLRDGTKVAVKRGSGTRQGNPEFQTEIQVLSQIRHRHLVSLIGYCDDQSEMILVYEYMEKGPLKDLLYGSDLPCLTWKQRLEICIGAARGLHYLHTGYSQNIIHRDIKSTNILLGEGYLAKVADFGLSRVGPSLGETHVSTRVKGTFGYLDPEYFKIQKLTDKSDVYSFGVMLFEVLCARPVIDPNQSREQLNLAEWALIWQRKGKLEKIIDKRLIGNINANSLRKFGETAEKCLADYGVDRPTIGDVLWNLEYALQLHETELRREPFEDSGKVESQAQIQLMRKLPLSSAIDIRKKADEADEENSRDASEEQSGTSESKVFSQLRYDDGR